MEKFIDRSIEEVQKQVGPNERVVCGLSGGVDSAVAAAARRRALGRGWFVFVDNGLLRAGERQAVSSAFSALRGRAPRRRCLSALGGSKA
ncbi:MAG: hypothetical protein U0794_21875 [Isosphaeraceae bacterium]